MSSLIRASDATTSTPVRSLDLASIHNEHASPAGIDASANVTKEDNELQRLREALKASEATRDKLVAQAREQGRLEAVAAHKRDDARMVALLVDAIDAGQKRLTSKLDELNRASLLICENALTPIFATAGDIRSLLVSAIETQIAGIRNETIVALRVSEADFAGRAALQELANRIGASESAIAADKTLNPGECVIDVRLGQIEISLPQFWQTLKARLQDLMQTGGRLA